MDRKDCINAVRRAFDDAHSLQCLLDQIVEDMEDMEDMEDCEKVPCFLEKVKAERERQTGKGYDAKHYEEHCDGSLSNTAACYAAGKELWSCIDGDYFVSDEQLEELDREEQLVRAAALLMAEYERLEILEQTQKEWEL